MQAQSSHALALDVIGEVSDLPHLADVSLTGANSAVAAGLRSLADWLDAHPELHRARWATVSLRSAGDEHPAREALTLVADALGERVSESRRFHKSRQVVDVTGQFGPVKAIASAYLSELAAGGEEPQDVAPITPGYREDEWWLTTVEIDRAFREAIL